MTRVNEDNLILKSAQLDDKDLLFCWANDSVTRLNSFNTKSITYEEHCKWYEQLMSSDSIKQYILVENGISVGQIRVKQVNDALEISYSIGPEYRGRGLGVIVLKLIKEKVKEDFPTARLLTGQVKPDNKASVSAFIDAGFKEIYKQFEIEL